jgi:hypothetical protein
MHSPLDGPGGKAGTSSHPGPDAPVELEDCAVDDDAALLEAGPPVPVLVGPVVELALLSVPDMEPSSSVLQPVHISKTSDEDTKTLRSVAFIRSEPSWSKRWS